MFSKDAEKAYPLLGVNYLTSNSSSEKKLGITVHHAF